MRMAMWITLAPMNVKPPRIDWDLKGGDAAAIAALYRLMSWLSPAFPIGAFSYSSGLEWTIEKGEIGNARELQNWIGSHLRCGGGAADAVFFVQAYRAAAAEDAMALNAITELAAAFAPSKERYDETAAQGLAFIKATQSAWPCAKQAEFLARWDGPIAYPIAVAVASAGHCIDETMALNAFLHATVSNLISAGVRLIPLGQTAGLRILAALEPAIVACAACAKTTPLDRVGNACIRADIASMLHETQYTRLFRS